MLDLETNTYTKSGKLPTFHLVTEQINVQYKENQTITIFVQANFDESCFQICCAINKGITEPGKPFEGEWEWLCQQNVDIDNFHIKTALIHGDKLLIFSRGKPKNTLEECCSFLLVLNIKGDGDNVKEITGFNKKGVLPKDQAQYNFIKLDPLVYPQFLSKVWVSRRD